MDIATETSNTSGNFVFLAEHDALFVELATAAERAFSSDPNTTLIKLRQLGEALAQHLAALSGIEFDQQTSQSDLLCRLQRELRLEPQIKELFHALQLQLANQGENSANQQRQKVAKQTKAASNTLVLSEELTRIRIDQQLNEAGWQADSQELTHQKGTRPEPGVNRAIAEWPTNHQGAKGRADYVLFAGLTPIGLLDLLERCREHAEQQLKIEPFGYLKLRGYQQKAVIATENVLAKGVRAALLAMATGTGKTRTVIGLMYRFLKAERFHRILFLVDRSALG